MEESQIIRMEYSELMKKSYIDYHFQSSPGCQGWFETGTEKNTL